MTSGIFIYGHKRDSGEYPYMDFYIGDVTCDITCDVTVMCQGNHSVRRYRQIWTSCDCSHTKLQPTVTIIYKTIQ